MSAYAGRGLHGQMVEEIGARIVHGHYKPGAALYADALEGEFEVSKTVVREALRVLAAKGLVETRQKRGTVVRPRSEWGLLDSDVLRWQGGNQPDFDFLENLAEVRAIIEPASARLAAQRRTEVDLTKLQEALDAMVAANADTIAVADVRFHRAVLAAAHNELLSQMDVVLATGLQLKDEFVHHSHGPSDSIPAHRALLGAIQAGDADLAGNTVEALLAQASKDLAAARQKSESGHRATRRR